ncbi:GntR family transcriptional regulator [Phreatobacter oligotrophus]|uniref:GntR family transcriptional regulator n=1 Tax=Phreatobacter oligotrophus TaxID=1122261 RepID=UPI002354CA8B|nr:GntR family transcriptional regulator [Phreatobacter oligotrophus]MBX9992122.1 GntR family transcriptional regulator [Phreatobacter oligotrophus]
MSVADALTTIGPLERETLGERVYGHLRELLMAGRLAPGDKISLRATALALGTSMMPVREAVSRLVADRALEVTPNRAVRVPVMSEDGFRELTTVRIAIEGFAAEAAAAAADARAIERIAGHEAAFRALGSQPVADLAEAVRINKNLHFAIYEAAGLPTLVEIIGALWLKAGPVLNLDLGANPDRLARSGAIRFHAEALAAIRARDGAAARTAIVADISGAADFIIGRGGLAAARNRA